MSARRVPGRLITVLLWIATIIAKGQPRAPAAASGTLIATAGPVLVVAAP